MSRGKNWSCEVENPHPTCGSADAALGRALQDGWGASGPVAVAEKGALDPRFQFFFPNLHRTSLRAFLSVPLMCRGFVVE